MNKKLVLYILAFFTCTVQAQEILTLQQCRKMAIENNKNMGIAAKKTQSAHYTMKSYWGNFFPNFMVSGTGAYSNISGSLNIPIGDIPISIPITPSFVLSHTLTLPDLSLDYNVKTLYTAGISVEQPIYMGGKIRSAYKMSKMGKEVAQLNENLTGQQVIIDTENAYVLLVKAYEMKKVAQSYYDVLEELMKTVNSAYKHGLKSQNDILKVQVKLNEGELGIRKADNAIRLATMNLCHFIGKPLTSIIKVSEDLPTITQQIAYQINDISARPEYSLLDKKVAIAHQQVKLSRSELLPQIGVKGSYSYTHGFKVAGDNLFDDDGFAVLLNVKIPVYHFGECRNKVKAAKTNLELARLEQADLNEKMLLELSQAANNLDEAQLEAEISVKSFGQAEENMKVSRSQYEAGMESLSDHLESQALWQQAYATKVNATYQLYLSYISYLKATGKLAVED